MNPDVTVDQEDVTVDQEIADVRLMRPHVVLLGAGASKAALPAGDKHGRAVPLMRDLAEILDLVNLFPDHLRGLAVTDFEAAFSQLSLTSIEISAQVEQRIHDYFTGMKLPDEPTLYDVLLLCLRPKDAVFTFNWDPFLIQALHRLNRLGVRENPSIFFLHGNVRIGYCHADECSGIIGHRCSTCSNGFEPGPLLFPVERKNYQDGGLIEREWRAVRRYLHKCFIFTVFGYSAPKTDVEAVALLKEGWGELSERQFEQVEIIDRPDADEEDLRRTWEPFIHTHHYDVFGSFYDSSLANHPRRTCEATFSTQLAPEYSPSSSLARASAHLSSDRR